MFTLGESVLWRFRVRDSDPARWIPATVVQDAGTHVVIEIEVRGVLTRKRVKHGSLRRVQPGAAKP